MGNIKFLLGAATAAHQVEGNNVNSDFWAMEQMEHSSFAEPSLDGVDHYGRFKEDIDLMAANGLNAYRFPMEWARIEPQKGNYSKETIDHYRQVLSYCHEKGIEPIVTMHHFSSPKWLIREGGWEAESTIDAFAAYCRFVVSELGDLLHYVCTINEANMGLQLAALAERYIKQMADNMAGSGKDGEVQVGINVQELLAEQMEKSAAANKATFGVEKAETFLSVRTIKGDQLIMRAHEAARKAMKEVDPRLQIGLTLSVFDIQHEPDGEEQAKKAWEEEFGHCLPYIKNDDFLGLQNYTRSVYNAQGLVPIPQDAELTQMEYEYYPQALENVIRAVAAELSLPILITENGIATNDDSRRCSFIREALMGVKRCIEDGIPVKGYMHWSLLDNFEWQKGYEITFGLIAVDRSTQKRYPKESLNILGQMKEMMKK